MPTTIPTRLTFCWAQPLKTITIATNKTTIPTFFSLVISVSFQEFSTKLIPTYISTIKEISLHDKIYLR
jgi:hypothetical protein